MPNYVFESMSNPEEHCYMFFTMAEVPSVGTIVKDEDGLEWRRIFTVPQATSNITKIDPYSAKDFNRRLDNKSVTIGQMWDEAAALSQRRAEKDGKDTVKEKYYEKYASERQGARHPQELKEKQQKDLAVANKKLEKLGISIKNNK